VRPHPIPSFRTRLFAACLFLTAGSLVAAPPGAGQPAPAIQSTDLDGHPFSLAALKGHVVILDFWASWCGPCRKSLPGLDHLQSKYKGQGLQVVGVSLDETQDAVTDFLTNVPVHFTILQDPFGTTGQAFGVVAMPTTFLLDREGRIAARFEGGDHLEAEEAAVATLLAGGTVAPESGARVAAGLRATGALKAWNRGHLADPIMSLDGDPVARIMREHIYASKEAAAGDGGAAGGGCGCN
jgi:thiol-disulfide isomerase/thioredoxin